MGCFCRQSVTELQQKLRRMEPTAGGGAQTPPDTQQSEAVASSAAWLSARGLPAPPWRPDPQWLAAKLPTPQLPPEAVATLTQLATLRQQMQSALGIDPLQPEQTKQLTRIVATQNRRLTDLAKTPPPDAGPWQDLAAQSEAADAVQEAAKSGLLDPSPEQVEAYSQPAGRPMRQWLALLRQVRALAPLVAAANQLGLPLDQPEELAQRLADAVRKLRNVVLPPPAEPLEAARLMSLLSASDRLKQTLGVDPAEAGYQEVQRAVAKKTQAAATLLQQMQRGQQQPPANLPYCPTLLASPAVIKAATSEGARELAAINWKVPPASSLPALQSGLQASTLARQMTAVLGSSPVRQTPCGQNCDAAKVMRDLE